ncbi:MAG: leucyl aminopeptidase [Candidatus Kariarchaeaceae archaeon]
MNNNKMKISAIDGLIESQDVDGIILGMDEGQTVKSASLRIKADLDTPLSLGDFSGKEKEIMVLYNIPSVNAERVVLVGLGKSEEVNHETIRIAAAKGVKKLRRLGAKKVAIEGFNGDGQSTAEGALLGLYRFDELMTQKLDEKKSLDELYFVGDSHEIETWNRGVIIAKAENKARRIAELPSNIATPTYITELAKKLISGIDNTEIIIRDETWAKEKKMGSFLSVAAGTDEPAKFLEIHYRGGPTDTQPLVLVGKGITFDSGGISLKPGAGMGMMRGDCGGAAAVIGSMYGIAKLGLPVNVIGLAPLTENMPSGKATKPADVVFASNGKSIEIDNTDAEGRLILADGLVYGESAFNPHTIIDIATLTGSIEIALGEAFAGAFTRSNKLWSELEQAGLNTQERFWRMPLDPIYRKQIKSTLADVKNTGGRPAGASTAAMFLGEFVEMERWAHIDIAGVASGKKGAYKPEGMSGIPVRSMIELASNFSTK